MKKILIFTVLLVGVLVFGFTQTGNTWIVNNTAVWIEAVNGIRSGGNNKTYTITVNGNVSVPSSAESTFGSVTGITVTIEGSGTLSPSANGSLLFVGTGQTVVAKNVTLRGRTDNGSFSVVGISSEGIFRMEGSAKVTGNTTDGYGGGVYVDCGNIIMQDTATVSGNSVNTSRNEGGGGGVYVIDGTFIMQGNASVSNNTVISGNKSYNGGGGGILIYSGTFTIQDSATVSNNSAKGIYDSWTGFTSPVHGGGIYIRSGTFTMKGGSISKNTANSSGGGSGIYNNGTFIMEGGSISDNTGSSGVGNSGTVIMRGNANVYRNTNTSSHGGGVYNRGDFTMEEGTISGNTVSANDRDSCGGGIYNYGIFTMKGGTISENTVSATGRKNIGYSQAYYFYRGDGGGVYNWGDNTTFTLQGTAVVSGNTASGSGGGVFNNRGTFTIQDRASVLGNTATYEGGGVYNNGNDYDDEKTFIKTGGTIYGDDADQNLKNTVISRIGHAVYEAQNGSWRNSTAGPTMNSDSYGLWLNDGDVAFFPSGFVGSWRRSNFNNTLTLTKNTIRSTSSDNLWVLQSISGNAYTFKRSNATNTITLTIRVVSGNLIITGDSGSGQDNWNGSWYKQRE
jgi:hypothetical protein